MLVNGGIKESFSAPFWMFAVAWVKFNVRNQRVIKADFAGSFTIKGSVSVEIRWIKRKFELAFESFEQDFHTRS